MPRSVVGRCRSARLSETEMRTRQPHMFALDTRSTSKHAVSELYCGLVLLGRARVRTMRPWESRRDGSIGHSSWNTGAHKRRAEA
jgi:hypothetical protein